MPIPASIDLDKVTAVFLQDIMSSVNGWLSGRPLDETALMNRLSSRLVRRRRGCDVGATSKVVAYSQVAVLHRQGPAQVDLYGADIAVTLWVEPDNWMKTALFQLKRSSGPSVTVERRQLDQALEDPRTAGRSFVVAVDDSNGGMRVESVQALVERCSAATHLYNVSGWPFLVEWFWGWLACLVGQRSLPGGPDSIESLLQQYTMEEPQVTGWLDEALPYLPEGMLPAKAWLSMLLYEPGTDSVVEQKLKAMRRQEGEAGRG